MYGNLSIKRFIETMAFSCHYTMKKINMASSLVNCEKKITYFFRSRRSLDFDRDRDRSLFFSLCLLIFDNLLFLSIHKFEIIKFWFRNQAPIEVRRGKRLDDRLARNQQANCQPALYAVYLYVTLNRLRCKVFVFPWPV